MFLRNTARIGALLTALTAFSNGLAAAQPGQTVTLQGLDKVTARTSTFQAGVGETVKFGTLVITVRACDRTPPTEPPESRVFLDIVDARPGEAEADLFHGWMFASSPGLNALEHPVFDVWALECLLGDKTLIQNFPVPKPRPNP